VARGLKLSKAIHEKRSRKSLLSELQIAVEPKRTIEFAGSSVCHEMTVRANAIGDRNATDHWRSKSPTAVAVARLLVLWVKK